MRWFEKQLENRMSMDNSNLETSIDNVAQAIMGQKLAATLSRTEQARSAAEKVLKYFNLKPRELPENEKLQTLEEQLEYQLRPNGVMYRTVDLDAGWYRNAAGPMLCNRESDGYPIVVLPRGFGYQFQDPDTGKKIKLSAKTEALLGDQALCFYKPLPQKALTVADLLLFAMSQCTAWDLFLLIGSMGVATLLGMISPMLNKWLFGDVLNSGNLQVLLALAGFMLSFSVTQAFYGAFKNLISIRISTKQNVAVQAAVMNRLMSLPVSFFRGYSSGELHQRSEYIQGLCSMLLDTVGTTCITSVFSLVYIGQVFTYAPSLVVPSLWITAATLVVTLFSTLAQVKISRARMKIAAKNAGMAHSMITGIQKIKLAGAEKRFFARWANQYAKEAALEYNPPLFLKLSNAITLAITVTGTMIMYGLATISGVTASDYYAFNSAYGMVSGAFMSLAGIAGILANVGPILEMAAPIMEAIPEAADEREIVTGIRGSIELGNVSFRYDDSMPWVLDNVSLKIKAGEYLAIVGGTGCGKSTLLRLLLGFETPQKGYIHYDKKDITRVDLRSLRRQIGMVMQDGKLFLGDIFSNISVSAANLTMDQAWEAAEMAAVADDIRAMPMGMHTIISEGQGGISGGQRQRLLIARAVASKPKVLIFDEATSALDNITQKKVSDAIDSLKCTRIVVAHRLSTIQHCDRIVVLDKGKIAEEGTYEQLIAKGGFFAELVERQRLDR